MADKVSPKYLHSKDEKLFNFVTQRSNCFVGEQFDFYINYLLGVILILVGVKKIIHTREIYKKKSAVKRTLQHNHSTISAQALPSL